MLNEFFIELVSESWFYLIKRDLNVKMQQVHMRFIITLRQIFNLQA